MGKRKSHGLWHTCLSQGVGTETVPASHPQTDYSLPPTITAAPVNGSGLKTPTSHG